MGAPSARSDAWFLEFLDRLEAGQSAAEIARAMGLTRSAVLGLAKRLRDDAARHPDRARLRQNRDGGMPAGWWKAGLAMQARRKGAGDAR